MARKSLSQQLAELREHCARIEGELNSMYEINRAQSTKIERLEAGAAKIQQQATGVVSARRAAMELARHQAMTTGRTVPVHFMD